ncbi:DUF6188 family protein [Kitasatospora sp. NPDC048540]|uniref:DUF6188 family protein n=1 Tax=unclassified Kitasatospora TaxID=2633591 RepID=UPI000539D8DA|nr:DUF6188 family protein [Kitasatospora sp. MBT63]
MAADPIEGALRGHRVETVEGGYRLRVGLTGGLAVTVDNDFRLTGPHEVEHFYPGLTMAPAGGLAALVGALVTAVRVSPAGSLEMDFDTGRTLAVPPEPGPGGPAVAWRVSGPGGALFTSVPGGYLSG